MAARSFQYGLLAKSESILSRTVSKLLSNNAKETRIQVLEACAARFGGFDYSKFCKVFNVTPVSDPSSLLELAEPLATEIEQSAISFPLALSALAQEQLSKQKTKSSGAYHTDFRLANALAEKISSNLTHKSRVIDPACGTGMLLAALTEKVCGHDRQKTNFWLKSRLFASDLSEHSLRGAVLALASMTNSVDVLKEMRSNWHCGDSLTANKNIWSKMSAKGFDGVIANPPWEKIKISKHEFLKSRGEVRHYGASSKIRDVKAYEQKRASIGRYADELANQYEMLRGGEADLYIAFTELFSSLCSKSGKVAAILPGGVIRSKGTEAIRGHLFETKNDIDITVFDNRSRFFEIDTRFKFIFLLYANSSKSSRKQPIKLSHAMGTPTGVENFATVKIGRANLRAVRPDLTVPEVKSVAEWKLFNDMAASRVKKASTHNWDLDICREVDMTKERKHFSSSPRTGSLPLVEGRMVQQFRLGAKSYISGSGRRANWAPNPIGGEKIQPQFWINPKHLTNRAASRVESPRAGFCDVVGQTNERTMMAGFISPHVACGNKVPTVMFDTDQTCSRTHVWLSIVNSFTFDWYLRRIVTTTVNYFLLRSVPLPAILENGLPWKKLEKLSRSLTELNAKGVSDNLLKSYSILRSEIDAEVATAYGLTLENMLLIFEDFPLIDRHQPTLPDEARSTITRDLVIHRFVKRNHLPETIHSQRAQEAFALGARSHIPSDFSKVLPTSPKPQHLKKRRERSL